MEEEEKAPKSSIYTKTGDRGTSSLYSGERRPKDDPIFEALGTVDELNANIGVARQYCAQAGNLQLDTYLASIQSTLLDLGSCIATPVNTSSEAKIKHVEFNPDVTEEMESWTDQLDARLPPLKNFILPSGGFTSAHLHVARAVCRRLERRIWPLVNKDALDDNVAIFLNRLSDFLFVSSRFAAQFENKQETMYKKGSGTKEREL
eukprot:TRINITY_DN3713_c0_g1_i3.p1 TRINITY_DN3713_c0_g1~~TRINITY_DN3713_c0_g1_i3.p1  ORF type:complete len:205 (-),score=59.22 TRINITY_DN3713_c0_g1_i3:62-676(-)